MDVAYRRENGLGLDGSRGRYTGTLTRSPTYRRTLGRMDGVESPPSRSSFVTTGSLIIFALALTLTTHFVLFNRTKQKLGF